MLDRSHNFIGKMTYIWKSSYIKGEAVRLKERRTCLNGAGEAAERLCYCFNQIDYICTFYLSA